jgi:hypothetical protein
MEEPSQSNNNETTVDVSSSGTVTDMNTKKANQDNSHNSNSHNSNSHNSNSHNSNSHNSNSHDDNNASQSNNNETTVDVSSSGTVTDMNTKKANQDNSN